MSLLFSEISYTSPHGQRIALRESGHPDEHDMRELLEYEARYATVKKAAQNGAVIQVRHYRFQRNGREWLAEQDHFALIDIYDALARTCGAREFTQREDVALLGQYQFRLDNACGSSLSDGC